jgi:ATP-dependent Zn protease
MTVQKTDRWVPRWLAIAIIAVLGFFALSALLFAWINASAPPTAVGYSQFLADVEAGRVTKVEQEGDTLTVSAGDRYTVVVPSILTNVYGDMQAAADNGGLSLAPEAYVAVSAPATSWLGLVLTGILPLTLLIVVFGIVVYVLTRRGGGGPDAASRLRALDTAWKAGLVTDAERDTKRAQIIEAI